MNPFDKKNADNIGLTSKNIKVFIKDQTQGMDETVVRAYLQKVSAILRNKKFLFGVTAAAKAICEPLALTLEASASLDETYVQFQEAGDLVIKAFSAVGLDIAEELDFDGKSTAENANKFVTNLTQEMTDDDAKRFMLKLAKVLRNRKVHKAIDTFITELTTIIADLMDELAKDTLANDKTYDHIDKRIQKALSVLLLSIAMASATSLTIPGVP